jgi:hypothetical protein
MEMVETFDGTLAPKDNCRKYNGKYYEIGRQCFKMPNGRYYRIDSNLVVYDYDVKNYVLKSAAHVKGIVDYKKDKPVYAHFKFDPIKSVAIPSEGIFYDESVLLKSGKYVEDIRTGIFVRKNKANKKFYRPTLGGSYNFPFDYSADRLLQGFTNSFNKHFNPPKVKHFWKFLPDNVTVGLEYETYAGKIPENKCLINGLIPVKDGSLRKSRGISFEYATVILDKNVVFPAIKTHSELLNKYCSRSVDESLHVHIGGYSRSDEMLVSLYRTVCTVQDEIYKMFPLLLKRTALFKSTGKNYCQPLNKNLITYDDFEHDLENIVLFLSSDNVDLDSFHIGMSHPIDAYNEHKWAVNSRYYICNLNHYAFAGSGTVEFRIHNSTFNKDKIAAWIFITSAIVEYAFRVKDENPFNKNITLNSIIDTIYKDKMLNKFLKAYIKYRKDLMNMYQSKYHDFIGVLDVKCDNLNNFNFPIKEIV